MQYRHQSVDLFLGRDEGLNQFHLVNPVLDDDPRYLLDRLCYFIQ